MIARRLLHTRVPLPYKCQAGLAPFLSPHALTQINDVWANDLVTKLNHQIQGTDNQTKSLYQTVRTTALDPNQSLTYTYASLLFSTHLFLSQLSPNSEPLPSSSDLFKLVENTYGSLEGLKAVWQTQALSFPHAGHMWLTYHAPSNKLDIRKTVGAGTVLVSGGRREMNFGDIPEEKNEIFPLLCLSLWERNWLWDYGIQGKEEYVKRWWSVLNWTKVNSQFEDIRQGVVKPPTDTQN